MPVRLLEFNTDKVPHVYHMKYHIRSPNAASLLWYSQTGLAKFPVKPEFGKTKPRSIG